jgi:hypothetical protein
VKEKTGLYQAQLHVPQTAVAPTVVSGTVTCTSDSSCTYSRFSKSQDLRFSQQSCCGTGLLATGTLMDCSVCICRMKWSNTLNMRHCNPSKHQQLVTQQHSVTSQMTGIFSYLLLLQGTSLTLYFCAFSSLSRFNHKWPPFQL